MDNRKYEIINFFDKCRWKEIENYGECNYCTEIQKDDYEIKLLIHWLSYITDRQIKYRQIWDVGTYVFSKLILEYKKRNEEGKEKICENILNYKNKNSFFIKIDKKDVNEEDFDFSFVAPLEENEKIANRIKKYKNSYEGKKVYFKPRFYPADFLSIYKTLYILEKYYNGSFKQYIQKVIDKIENKEKEEDLIKGLVNGLYLLTYSNDKKKKDYVRPKEKNEKRERYFNRVLETKFEDPLLEGKINTNFNKYDKRLWCAFRDYIKSERYKPLFEKIIEDEKIFKKIISEEAKKYLELPGDVWNNNSQFSKCLFEKEFDEDKKQYNKVNKNSKENEKTKKFNVFLRDIYETMANNEQDIEWYPEKFDITFDFVPKMCSVDNCNICPFNVLKKEIKLEELKKICKEGKEEAYCTVALICCGYKVKCGDMKENGKCKLMQTLSS